MSLDISGLKYLIPNKLKIEVSVPRSHPMIILAKNVPWNHMADLVVHDLYKNRKRSGRKLNIRLHLGAFILQSMNKWTDRTLEDMIKYHGPTMIFCGVKKSSQGIDHSQYTRFRNRISEETAKDLSTLIIQKARDFGFTSSAFMDIDSTVQEANICYPSDISMMRKLVQKSEKLLKHLESEGSSKAKEILRKINFKKIGKDIKGYFFVTRGEAGQLEKKTLLKKIEKQASSVIKHLISVSGSVLYYGLSWNLKKDWNDVTVKGEKLLKDIRYFIKNQKMKEGKILSLSRAMVTCIRKGKIGKLNEFGRKWFLAKLEGNYAFGFSPKDEIRLEDSRSVGQGLKHFEEIFSSFPLSITGDQGFWSDENVVACLESEIAEIGIHPRGHLDWLVNDEDIERLKNRRASTEGIIGHVKMRGMGKSKMKSDEATHLEGQRAILSLNLSRFTKDLELRKLRCAG
ncbi:MAG TPA: transposase [Bacteriovoracaceae bacterium]|nr:transposase [Bacteriovoracaceae bacterium]